LSAGEDDRSRDELRVVRLLGTLEQAELASLARRCQWRDFEEGETILRRDDRGDEVCFVVRGRVRVGETSPEGREIVFAEIGVGEHIGEMAAIDGGHRSADVVAATDCRVACLPGADFCHLLHRNPEIALALLRDAARIIRLNNIRITELTSAGAVERICRELLRRAHAVASSTTWVIDELPTQETLAAVTGTTRETVAKVMSQLAHAGLVHRFRRSLEITDIGGLCSMAGMPKAPSAGSAPIDRASRCCETRTSAPSGDEAHDRSLTRQM